ncbi:MAG: hypothetical protein ACK5PT_18735 [Cereibacter sp.]
MPVDKDLCAELAEGLGYAFFLDESWAARQIVAVCLSAQATAQIYGGSTCTPIDDLLAQAEDASCR